MKKILTQEGKNRHTVCMKQFDIIPGPKLIFGRNTFTEIVHYFPDECKSKVGIVTGARSFQQTEHWDLLAKRLKDESIQFSHGKITGEPTPEQIDTISKQFNEEGVQMIVAIGGGSPLDAGKAIAAMIGENCCSSVQNYLEGVGDVAPSGKRLPLIAVPTTAGTGSEATKNAVISRVGEGGFKKSLRHDSYIPDLALIDPELFNSCPGYITTASGLDALSQLIEAYLSSKSSSYSDAFTIQGLKHAFHSLYKLAHYSSSRSNEHDSYDTILGCRGEMALAAHYSGIGLANAGLGAVHGLASTIGGLFPIPHGVICARLLPSFLKLIEEKKGDPDLLLSKKIENLCGIFSEYTSGDRNPGVYEIIKWIDEISELGGLEKLSSFGITESHCIEIAQQSGQKNTPVALTTEDLSRMVNSVL